MRAVKKKNKKRVMLSDKERRQWAHEHWLLHRGRESVSVHAKQLGQEVRAVKSVVKTVRALPTWTVAKAAVFDSSSEEEEEIFRATTVSSSVSSSSWAAAAPRPDLSDNCTSQDSVGTGLLRHLDQTLVMIGPPPLQDRTRT